MPLLETPPNPAAPPEAPEPAKVRAGRHGDLEHAELVHLLDSYDDERQKANFREAAYIAFIVYLALAWLAIYGPRVLFHQGRLVAAQEEKRDKHELSYLDLPKSLVRKPKPTNTVSDQNRVAQTPKPTPKQPTPEQLQAMKRAGDPNRAPNPPAPKPQPQPKPQQPAPQPQQQQPAPQQAQQQQLPKTPAPQPRPTQQALNNIPDAPRPSSNTGRPSFSTPDNAGDAIRNAANAAARGGGGGEGGLNAPRLHAGVKSGMDILSDTQGVDFAAWQKQVYRSTYAAWIPLIPEECAPPLNKDGYTVIRLTVYNDGRIGPMRLEDSNRDVAIDKAAWGSIISQGQLPKLPAGFKGNLELRWTYRISHDGRASRE